MQSKLTCLGHCVGFVMNELSFILLVLGGFFPRILAELLGIGGGTVLVPILVAFGYTPVQAVATSSLAILVASISVYLLASVVVCDRLRANITSFESF